MKRRRSTYREPEVARVDRFEKVMAVVIVATCVGFLLALLALIGGAL